MEDGEGPDHPFAHRFLDKSTTRLAFFNTVYLPSYEQPQAEPYSIYKKYVGHRCSSRFVDDASMQSKKEEEDSRIADVHCVACSLFYRSKTDEGIAFTRGAATRFLL